MTARIKASCLAEASCISSGYFSHNGVLFSKSVKRKVAGFEAMSSFLSDLSNLYGKVEVCSLNLPSFETSSNAVEFLDIIPF
jgi:hypothetical protein